MSVVATVGESMGLFDPIGADAPQIGTTFRLRFAGAESNFAIALARLGVPVSWVSRLGVDPIGDMILGGMTEEGVDVSHVRRDAAAPTGLFVKWRGPSEHRNLYFRGGSAASLLEPADVTDEWLGRVRHLHMTGITLALGASPRALVHDLVRRACRLGISISFDPNYRPALWEDVSEARAAQRNLLPYVDWYLCGVDEARALFVDGDNDDPVAIIEAAGVRPGGAVVRIGARGVLVRERGSIAVVPPVRVVAEVRDEIGAGDGFAAGFVWGMQRGQSPSECARAGNLVAAAALRGTGDWETYPRLEQLLADLA